jgi:predicted AAA+ superfamily ATPase
MIVRHLAKALKAAAKQYPVVTLTGPRQSGKTTLVRASFPKHSYISLEDPDHRAFALSDPRGFLDQFSGKVILDEAQRVPELFSYIQGIVDEADKAGHFVLTGSQDFLLLQKVSQSLAGRCAVLHLLPFSRSELANRPMTSLDRIIAPPSRRRAGSAQTKDVPSLFDTLFHGFYPRIHDKGLEPQKWLANYYRTYLERDVREVLNVGDLETFGRFVRLCAGRCGQLLSLSSLASDAGISHTTARRWLSILEASFLVYLLRPHHKNFNKRLVKSPKLYFLDTGLLCYLLRIRDADDLAMHASRGAIFEAWVLSELLKIYHHQGLEPDVYFWRDSAGHEVDLLIDRGNSLVPVEIKSGQTIADDAFKGLAYWRTLPEQGDCLGALVYGGASSYVRKGFTVKGWQDWG